MHGRTIGSPNPIHRPLAAQSERAVYPGEVRFALIFGDGPGPVGLPAPFFFLLFFLLLLFHFLSFLFSLFLSCFSFVVYFFTVL
jgi:hypothetical protein